MTINLLPPSIKQEKEYRKILNYIFYFLSCTLIILIFFVAIIYIADMSILVDIDKNKKETTSQDETLKGLAETSDKVDIINSKLDKISQIDSSKVIWSNVIKDLANDTPKNVQITTLSLEKDTNKVQMTGSAATRRDIASFKEKLEASKYFKNVTFSTSSHSVESDTFSFNLFSELENIK